MPRRGVESQLGIKLNKKQKQAFSHINWLVDQFDNYRGPQGACQNPKMKSNRQTGSWQTVLNKEMK